MALAPVAMPGRARAGATPGWTSKGLLVCDAVHEQSAAALAADGTGGFFVAWEDSRAVADTSDLYALHLLGDGSIASGWPAEGAALSLAPGSQSMPQIARDDLGGLFAVWEDHRAGSTPRLYAQHLSSTSVPLAGWPAGGRVVCSKPGIQRAAKIVTDGAGGALIFWEDYRATQPRIFAQHLQGDGGFAPGWPDTGRAVAFAAGGQVSLAAVADGAGGAYITWCDARGGGVTLTDIYAQRMKGDGTPATDWPGSGVAVCMADGAQDRPGVALDGLGGAVFTWTDPRIGVYNIFAQRLTGAGAVVPGWQVDGLAVSSAPPGQFDPVVTSDGAGGVLAAWVDARGGPSNADIYAQRLDPGGSPAWAADGFPVCTAVNDQLTPRILDDGAGGAIVCWQDGRISGSPRLYAQRITMAGVLAPGWTVDGREVADTNLVAEPAALVTDGAGGAICAWSGLALDGGTGETDIFASRFTGDGVVANEAALISADVRTTGVSLRWWIPGDAAPWNIERKESPAVASDPGDSGWETRATVWSGDGLIQWEDAEVAPGTRYGYRLRGPDGPAGEVWVTVPFARLALSRLGAQPAADQATFAVTLPRATGAALEVFDLAGRRRIERALDGADLAPRVSLDLRSLEAGLYWVRLRQDAAEVRSRLVVAR